MYSIVTIVIIGWYVLSGLNMPKVIILLGNCFMLLRKGMQEVIRGLFLFDFCAMQIIGGFWREEGSLRKNVVFIDMMLGS